MNVSVNVLQPRVNGSTETSIVTESKRKISILKGNNNTNNKAKERKNWTEGDKWRGGRTEWGEFSDL